MKSAVFHPLAEQELIDAAAYYEEQRLGLGLEYLGEVEHAVNFLIRYPEAGSSVRACSSSDFTQVPPLSAVLCLRK